MAASSCQDEPVLQLVQGRTPKDEQNLDDFGMIMMDPNLLDHWTIGCSIFWGDDEYPFIIGEVTRVPGF